MENRAAQRKLQLPETGFLEAGFARESGRRAGCWLQLDPRTRSITPPGGRGVQGPAEITVVRDPDTHS